MLILFTVIFQCVLVFGTPQIYIQDKEADVRNSCRQIVGICTRIRIPVCASNGNTYDNQCMLNEAICVHNKINERKAGNEGILFKMYEGICPTISILRDSGDCKDIECASVEEVVCGTDGLTYTNECAIKTAACIFEEKSELKVAFNGSCDSQRDTQHPDNNIGGVQVDNEREAIFVAARKIYVSPYNYPYAIHSANNGKGCPVICTTHYSPVCGTDGISYSNVCSLQSASCRNRKRIKFKHLGYCNGKTSVMDIGFDIHSNTEVLWSEETPNKLCMNMKNGKELDHLSCQNLCEADAGCVGISVTQTRNDYVTQTKCFLCQDDILSTAGANYGFYRKPLGLSKKDSSKQFIGLQNFLEVDPQFAQFDPALFNINQPYIPSWDVFLDGIPFYNRPYPIRQLQHYPTRRLQQGRKECQNFCGQVYRPLCGSDGKDYASNCSLTFTNCLAHNRGEDQIQKVYDGKCQQVSSIASDDSGFEIEQLVAENEDGSTVAEVEQTAEDCPSFCTFEYDPVCGTDGETYSNLCDLKVTACISNKIIKKAYEGECDEDVSSEFVNPSSSNTPQQDVTFDIEPVIDDAVQSVQCPFKPVCGTDGITYSNACTLKQTSEAYKLNIDVLHEGRCTS